MRSSGRSTAPSCANRTSRDTGSSASSCSSSVLRVRALGTIAAAVLPMSLGVVAPAADHLHRIAYADLQTQLATAGVSQERFPVYLRELEADSARRLADGEREHLIYYALQSMRFTSRPRIEPAASARRFVDGLSPSARRRLLDDPAFVPPTAWPTAERERIADALAAVKKSPTDPRLAYFGTLRTPDDRPLSLDALFRDYVRIARFLYKKELLASDAVDVARLYQSRPHSSDTQIEAGFGVYVGLGALHGLEPARQLARVLIVGPGLDVAPRTDLVDVVDPQSYQPIAIADAILSLGIGSETRLRVPAVDINPRVVRAVETMARDTAAVHVFSGIVSTAARPFSADYASYVEEIGRAIGDRFAATGAIGSHPHYRHSIAVRPQVRRALTAQQLD